MTVFNYLRQDVIVAQQMTVPDKKAQNNVKVKEELTSTVIRPLDSFRSIVGLRFRDAMENGRQTFVSFNSQLIWFPIMR